VINDPALSASQPLGELAASAGNALGHVAEGLVTPLRNPVTSLAALESARLMAAAFSQDDDAGLDERARDRLGLAALLAGYVIGSTWYGLHHVLSQTLVRFAEIGHGPANTIMLQHTLPALARRAPAELDRLGTALGEDPPAFARRLAAILGPTRLRDAGVQHDRLAVCVEHAAARPELAMTPPAADVAELTGLYDAAY
jgi:alcohol dehydrogenase class IV